jgi:heme exporter protein B
VNSIPKQIIALVKKEFLIEFRDKNPLFSLIVYVFGTGLICYLGLVLKTNKIDGITWNALFWINIFFVSQIATAKSFFGESKNRDFYYAFVCKPEAVIASKILYNFLTLFLLSLISFIVFTGIFNQKIGSQFWFITNLMMGSLSLAVGQSFLASIASKANNNATLLAVLSVPVMAPLILFLVRISNNAIDAVDSQVIVQDLLALGSINLIIISVSFLLFPYLWRS